MYHRIIMYGVILLAPLWVPLMAGVIVLLFLYWTSLYLAIWTWWLPRGRNILIVYSNSVDLA